MSSLACKTDLRAGCWAAYTAPQMRCLMRHRCYIFPPDTWYILRIAVYCERPFGIRSPCIALQVPTIRTWLRVASALRIVPCTHNTAVSHGYSTGYRLHSIRRLFCNQSHAATAGFELILLTTGLMALIMDFIPLPSLRQDTIDRLTQLPLSLPRPSDYTNSPENVTPTSLIGIAARAIVSPSFFPSTTVNLPTCTSYPHMPAKICLPFPYRFLLWQSAGTRARSS